MTKDLLTDEDWDELKSLKSAITDNPASMATQKMEKFTELLVKSLYGKGDGVSREDPTNY